MGQNDRQARKPSRPRKSHKVEFAGFVNAPLTKEQGETLESEFEELTATEVYDLLMGTIADGYSVKLTPPDSDGTCTCQIMDLSPDRSTSGYILTGFAHTPLKALFCALYKHTVIFDGVWDTQPRQRAMWG